MTIEDFEHMLDDETIYCPSCGDSLINDLCSECEHELELLNIEEYEL